MKLLIAGDYCPQGRVSSYIETGKYDALFSQIKEEICKVDYSIVNLEAPIKSDDDIPIIKAGPSLGCSDKVVDSIRYMDFKACTLANNHFRDFGSSAVNKTIECLKKAGVVPIGAGFLKDAQKVSYISIEGKNIGIVNVCEEEFSIATDEYPGSAPLRPIDNYYQINEAREKADFVIVIVHSGHEYYQLPSPSMKKNYRWFVDLGADAVINHHQHCFSGYEIYKGKPIFYGLGNFCFDWEGKRNGTWNQGYMVQLTFETDNISFKLIPYVQNDEKPGVRLMNELEQKKFDEDIAGLNSIIDDEDTLRLKHQEYIDRNKSLFKDLISPYNNRITLALCRRKILPLITYKPKLARLLDAFRCRANGEVFISMLEDELYK